MEARGGAGSQGITVDGRELGSYNERVQDAEIDAQADEVRSRAPEGMAGLAKGLAIIELFGSTSSRLSVASAAEGIGVARATARRCLLTLVDLGYVEYDGRYYRPTPRMLRLGSAYLDTSSLPGLADQHLTDARDELGESVSLAVWEHGWSIFVARAEAQRIVKTGVRVGARLPAHCSATGRVLLAALGDDEVREQLATAERERRTPHTLTDPGALLEVVRHVREEGFAISDEELELGMRAIAVPVTDGAGRTVAAMSVSASAARVSAERMRREFVPVLRREASLGRAVPAVVAAVLPAIGCPLVRRC
jgi:IclR family pca regulon transcriptional regulator